MTSTQPSKSTLEGWPSLSRAFPCTDPCICGNLVKPHLMSGTTMVKASQTSWAPSPSRHPHQSEQQQKHFTTLVEPSQTRLYLEHTHINGKTIKDACLWYLIARNFRGHKILWKFRQMLQKKILVVFILAVCSCRA